MYTLIIFHEVILTFHTMLTHAIWLEHFANSYFAQAGRYLLSYNKSSLLIWFLFVCMLVTNTKRNSSYNKKWSSNIFSIICVTWQVYSQFYSLYAVGCKMILSYFAGPKPFQKPKAQKPKSPKAQSPKPISVTQSHEKLLQSLSREIDSTINSHERNDQLPSTWHIYKNCHQICMR